MSFMIGIVLAVLISTGGVFPGTVLNAAVDHAVLQKEALNYEKVTQPTEFADYIKIEPLTEAYSPDIGLLEFFLTSNTDRELLCEYDDINFMKKLGNEWYKVPDMRVFSYSSGRLVIGEGKKSRQCFDISVMNNYTLDMGQYGISVKYRDNEGNLYQSFTEFPVVERGDVRTYEIWNPASPAVDGIYLELESEEYAVYPKEIRGTLFDETLQCRIYGERWFLLKKMNDSWRIIPRKPEHSAFPEIAIVLQSRAEKVYELNDYFNYDFEPGEYAIAFYISGNTPEQITVFSEFSMY